MLESHPSEEDKQVSLYLKISASRWANTAIILTIITPFTKTIAFEDGLIPQVYNQFYAEIVFVTIYQLADPLENFRRHVLAPRAASQDGMNLLMKGYKLELGKDSS